MWGDFDDVYVCVSVCAHTEVCVRLCVFVPMTQIRKVVGVDLHLSLKIHTNKSVSFHCERSGTVAWSAGLGLVCIVIQYNLIYLLCATEKYQMYTNTVPSL